MELTDKQKLISIVQEKILEDMIDIIEKTNEKFPEFNKNHIIMQTFSMSVLCLAICLCEISEEGKKTIPKFILEFIHEYMNKMVDK